MTLENYLNHPTFGLLYRVCLLEEQQELFTTLYAQRLFFVVKPTEKGLNFDPVSRSEARLQVENRLRSLRRQNQLTEFQHLNQLYKRTF